jgi:hypothetical protein
MIADAPQGLWALVVQTEQRGGLQLHRLFPARGNRNNELTSVAGALRRKGVSTEVIVETLLLLNESFAEPLDPREVNGSIGM